MGNLLTPTHFIIILLVILVLFGRGKVSEFMGDFAKGIKSFKKGMKDDDDDHADKTDSASKTSNTLNVDGHSSPGSSSQSDKTASGNSKQHDN